jgi:hypothetical protein
MDVRRMVFENGALAVNGNLYDSPDANNGGLYASLSLKREYLQLALAREETEWRRFRSECLQQAAFAQKYRNLPPPGPDAEKQLEAGKLRIQSLRLRLETIERLLAEESGKVEKDERRRRQADLEAERQAVTAGRAAAIRSMNL